MTAQVLVIGMSHVAALSRTMTQADAAHLAIVNLREARDIYTRKTKTLRLDRRAWKPSDMVCLSIGGNEHNIFSLVGKPAPFRLGDVVQGSVPSAGAGRPFVPRDMLSALVKTYLEPLNRVVRRIHAHFPQARFVHLDAPPPVRDLIPDRTAGLSEMQQNHLAWLDLDAAPAKLRLCIYQVQREILEQRARALGAVFLEPPPAACTPDGFLASAFREADDPTHGNAAYGRLVIDQIKAIASEGITA